MKTRHIVTVIFLLLMFSSVKAQWVVTDTTNLVKSIVNTTQQIVQTSYIARNILNNFKEVEKVYNQGKKYYDALKSINNLVKDARKVQETVLIGRYFSNVSSQVQKDDPKCQFIR